MNIGIPEGLSNNHNTDIIQDEYHYIWIATERELNRYNGSKMINFRENQVVVRSYC
jgi:ligand-binding sensor domain-containing protein